MWTFRSERSALKGTLSRQGIALEGVSDPAITVPPGSCRRRRR
ncbi:MAG: hypothetical protein R2715_24325 [Ilumatobacteraceae bacterium]